jgi:microcystin-dependent protein
MPHIVEDRILESTITTGTGDITLAAAITGFRRVSAVCAVGDTLPYFIEAIDATGLPTGDYEYGIGTYSAADTLTRTKVEGSSNAGALVNFAAGSKNVGMPALAGALVPTGARMEFLGNVVPGGYLELDGSLKSRVTYPALYAYALASGIMAASDVAWATDKGKFSPGDGATTFRIPDHRGYHARAWDHGAGVDAARAIGSTQADAVLQHNHTATVTDGGHDHTMLPGFALNARVGVTGGATAAVFADGGSTDTASATTGISVAIANTGGTENRVKTIAVLVCVKY